METKHDTCDRKWKLFNFTCSCTQLREPDFSDSRTCPPVKEEQQRTFPKEHTNRQALFRFGHLKSNLYRKSFYRLNYSAERPRTGSQISRSLGTITNPPS